MTTAMIDQPSASQLRPSHVTQPVRRRTPTRGPSARPERSASIPPSRPQDADLGGGSSGIASPHRTAVQGCRVSAVSRAATSWRLTDRGIALVLFLTAILVVAAVTVIGLTAWRVTGPAYQTTGVAELSPR